jgi:hypothetical protein
MKPFRYLASLVALPYEPEDGQFAVAQEVYR